MKRSRPFARIALVFAGILLFFAVSAASVATLLQDQGNHARLEGDRLVDLVENYRSLHGVLPEDLSRLGIPESEEGPYYYLKSDEEHYILWTRGISVGDSFVYRSERRAWARE